MKDYKCPHCQASYGEGEYLNLDCVGGDASKRACEYCETTVIKATPESVATLSPAEKMVFQAKLTVEVNNPQTAPDDKALSYKFLGLLALDNHAGVVAKGYLDKAVEANPMDADCYYYRALSLFNGKRPNAATRDVVNVAIQDLNMASAFNPADGIYLYLKALAIYDYYELRYMDYKENGSVLEYKTVLNQAKQTGFDATKADLVYRLLGNMNRPKGF